MMSKTDACLQVSRRWLSRWRRPEVMVADDVIAAARLVPVPRNIDVGSVSWLRVADKSVGSLTEFVFHRRQWCHLSAAVAAVSPLDPLSPFITSYLSLASCANQVAAVFRRTSTACSTNPDQHRQAGFQRRCTINVERFTDLRSPKWQLGHLQIKTENRTVHNCLWLLGRNVTSPSVSVPTQSRHHGALEILIVLYCIVSSSSPALLRLPSPRRSAYFFSLWRVLEACLKLRYIFVRFWLLAFLFSCYVLY